MRHDGSTSQRLLASRNLLSPADGTHSPTCKLYKEENVAKVITRSPLNRFIGGWGWAEGKPIPNELRPDEQKLRKKIEAEDDNTAVPRTHVDDEYAHAGERDPKILITTSRDPSSRLTQFAKELKLVFPNAERINRGGTVLPFFCPAILAFPLR